MAEQKAQAIATKKAAAAEKRRLAKEAKNPPKEQEEQEEEAPVEEPKKKKAKLVTAGDNEVPPKYLRAYISSVIKEENQYREKPIAKKDMKAKAEQVAEESWGNPTTRARVNEENNRHLTGMYSRIFGQRRL